MKYLALTLCAFASALAQAPAAAKADRLLKAGDYAGARKVALDAFRQAERSAPPRQLSDLLNTAGAAAIYQGEYPEALRLLERALALARQANSPDAEVLRLNNLGGLYVFLGGYGEAYSRYQQALERSEKAAPSARQLTLSNLASLYLQLGQTQRALESYQALKASQNALAPDIQAQTLANLAVTLRRLGDPHKALATLDQAERLLEKAPNPTVAQYLRVNRGIIQALDFEDYPGALAVFSAGARQAERRGLKREAVLARLFLAETLLRMERHREALAPLEEALAEARRLGLADDEWTAWFGLGRAQRGLGETESAQRSFEQAVTIIESERSQLGKSLKAEFLATKRDVYDALVQLHLEQPEPSPAAILRWIEGARARNLKERLSTGATLSLKSVQEQLPEGTAMAVYWTIPNQTAFVWFTRYQQGVVRRTGAAAPAVEQLNQALTTRAADWPAAAARAGELLGSAALDRPGVRRLMVVPDGAIHRIPFEVLPGFGGPALIEHLAISYLPSAHFVSTPRPVTANTTRWPWARAASIFADPAGSSPQAPQLFPGAEPPLPHSLEEAREIARALPGRSRIFSGAENLKSHVFDADVATAPVVHFATHATADTMDARNSRLVFSGTSSAERYLFLSDVERLRWPSVELVTLAACETEKGQYVRGEGVESFSRAFLAAGARSTMSSLWRVPDGSTSRFMSIFYRHLAEGMTKGDAIRVTKLAFRQEGAHPYIWAGFLINGDAGAALTLPLSWSIPAMAVLAVLSTALAYGIRVSLRTRSR